MITVKYIIYKFFCSLTKIQCIHKNAEVRASEYPRLEARDPTEAGVEKAPEGGGKGDWTGRIQKISFRNLWIAD